MDCRIAHRDLHFSDAQSQTLLVYWVATTAGYGLAGFACWRWIGFEPATPEQAARVRGPSRWMAAASLVTAAGVAALTYDLHRVHSQLGLGSAHYKLRHAGDLAGTVGFFLAAIGFWIASNALPAGAAQGSAAETEDMKASRSSPIAGTGKALDHWLRPVVDNEHAGGGLMAGCF